jgi:hypothetical protein
MTNPYLVEKQRVSVQALLPNLPVRSLTLFLEPHSVRETGFCRPSELLERPDDFLCVLDERGDVAFLARDAIMALAVPRHLEEGNEESEGLQKAAERQEVEVAFEDGTLLRGTLVYVLPEDHNRVQDYLMQGERHFRMTSGGSMYIVNKKRVVSVRPLQRQNGVG